MPVGVVDPSKTVDIEQEQRERVPVAPVELDEPLELTL
jgi:hypothetical protein